MRIVIETVENSELRYPTLGDWFYNPADKSFHIHVAKFEDEDYSHEKSFNGLTYGQHYEMLIAVHEFIEMYICWNTGVTQEQVDKWDMGAGKDDEEPGDNPEAPYFEEHRIATGIEHLVAASMGLSIRDYWEACANKDEEIRKLFESITPQIPNG